eukprot:1157648-Pelagomonas_calceolata.AAC.4
MEAMRHRLDLTLRWARHQAKMVLSTVRIVLAHALAHTQCIHTLYAFSPVLHFRCVRCLASEHGFLHCLRAGGQTVSATSASF